MRVRFSLLAPKSDFQKIDRLIDLILKIAYTEETPNPTIETVKKIADTLGVSLDDLME